MKSMFNFFFICAKKKYDISEIYFNLLSIKPHLAYIKQHSQKGLFKKIVVVKSVLKLPNEKQDFKRHPKTIFL